MAEQARRCIQELDERGCDYTILWLAKHYDFLSRFSGGEKILNFLEGEMALCRMQAQDPAFHKEITEEFVRRGVENRHPKRYVSAYYKEELFNLERDARWPEPYIPFLFQMRPGGFYLFWSWQTAFHWLRYKTIHDGASPFAREGPQLFYECQIVGYPARIILDCDAYLEEFGGRLSMQELQEIVAKIPVYFVTRLGEMGAIKREDTVVVVEKDKSRGGKASRHFVFNIIGIPTGDIKNVLHRVFVAQFQDERAEYNRRRKEFGKDPGNSGKCPTAWGHIDLKKGFPPALLTDTSTMHGRNQFSTLFCGKAGEEPPRISRIWRISNHGKEVQVKNGPWAGERHVPDHASAISMLGLACYSSLIPDAVTLRRDFDMPSEAKKKLGPGPDAKPRIMSGCQALSTTFLPGWLESAIQDVTGGKCKMNTTMKCLNKRHAEISKHIEGIDKKHMAHVFGLFCPSLAVQGVARMHTKNGCFVAVKDDVVYARCSDCACSDVDQSGSLLEIVDGTGGWQYPWVKLDNEAYSKMVGIHEGTQQTPRRKKART